MNSAKHLYQRSFCRIARGQPLVRITARCSRPVIVPWLHNTRNVAFSSSSSNLENNNRNIPTPDFDVKKIKGTMDKVFGDANDWTMEKLHKLAIVDKLISPQTLYEFIDCMYEGNLPGGKKSKYPLMRDDELPFLSTPYNKWTSAPYSESNHCIMDRVGGEFFSEGYATISGFLARHQALKAKLWNGLAPISGARWREKKLDDPKNFEQFYDLSQDIIALFTYWNEPTVQDQIRVGFSWLSDEYGMFESALNLRREELGIPERLNFGAIWAEYFRALLNNMSTRTHQWMVERVDEIQNVNKIEYMTALQAAGSDAKAITAAGNIFYHRVLILNDLMKRADVTINVPMQGYKSHSSATTGTEDLALSTRQDAYNKLVEAGSREHFLGLQDYEDPRQALHDPKALLRYFEESRNNIALTRKEFRGEPQQLGEEHWITILKSRFDFSAKHGGDPEKHMWGFVCYRLTYTQSTEEWAQVKAKIEADILKSGEWVQGANDVKSTRKLRWIDGKKLGIAEGDIEAAKLHFLGNLASFTPTTLKQEFLVVDMLSAHSYQRPLPKSPPFGDDGGHVRLVDTIKYNPEMIAATSPGFTGSFNVLTSLLFDEVYPLLASYAIQPREMWPLARLHPEQVYVGPTVASQEREWELARRDAKNRLQGFLKYVEMKQNEKAEKKV